MLHKGLQKRIPWLAFTAMNLRHVIRLAACATVLALYNDVGAREEETSETIQAVTEGEISAELIPSLQEGLNPAVPDRPSAYTLPPLEKGEPPIESEDIKAIPCATPIPRKSDKTSSASHPLLTWLNTGPEPTVQTPAVVEQSKLTVRPVTRTTTEPRTKAIAKAKAKAVAEKRATPVRPKPGEIILRKGPEKTVKTIPTPVPFKKL